jgi:hypothetical protein
LSYYKKAVIDQQNLDISSMVIVIKDGKKLCRGFGKDIIWCFGRIEVLHTLLYPK